MRLISERERSATYRRLLDTAGEIFAERGFRNATVREICRRAKANVAAVHYHFGDKDGLYAAVLNSGVESAKQKHPLPELVGQTPEDKLRMFVTAFLRRIFDAGRPSWHGRLMAREMIEPTRALDSLVEEHIRPNQQRLAGVVRELLGEVDDETVRLCMLSIVGQCLYYYHCRAVVSRLFPTHKVDVESLAAHITKFSIAALKEYHS